MPFPLDHTKPNRLSPEELIYRNWLARRVNRKRALTRLGPPQGGEIWVATGRRYRPEPERVPVLNWCVST